MGHPNHVFRLTSVVPWRYWCTKTGMWMKGCKVGLCIYRLNHDQKIPEFVHVVFLFQYFQESQNGNSGTTVGCKEVPAQMFEERPPANKQNIGTTSCKLSPFQESISWIWIRTTQKFCPSAMFPHWSVMTGTSRVWNPRPTSPAKATPSAVSSRCGGQPRIPKGS